MSGTPQGRGPLQWLHAIAESDLHPTDRLVCYALVQWINWATGEAYPGTERIAKGTGLGVRTVRAALRRLENRGALVVLRRSRGGIGQTHLVRLVPDVIRGRNPAGDAGLNPAADAGFTRQMAHQTRQMTTDNPAADAGKHTREQANEQTTTTTTTTTGAERTADGGRGVDAGKGGGGDGVYAGCGGAGGEGEHPPQCGEDRPESTGDRLDGPEAGARCSDAAERAYARLIDAGVTAPKARALIGDPHAVEAGLRWRAANAPKAGAGLLVRVIEDGTAEAWAKTNATDAAPAEDRQRKVEGYAAMLGSERSAGGTAR